MRNSWLVLCVASGLISLPACSSDRSNDDETETSGATAYTTETTETTGTGSETGPEGDGDEESGGDGDGDGDGDPCVDVEAPDEVLGPGADPAGGVFTLEQALEDLPEGPGPLRADLVTSLGTFTCTFEADQAPLAVANFIGLARGRRPWLDPVTMQWVQRPFYDGTIFHRVIPGFMIQGGDILGTGFGGPGYQFDDEFSSLSHTPGTLSCANSGPNTNGSQFFITEVATNWLDGVHTIMGRCEPVDGVAAVAAVPKDGNDKPLEDVLLETVKVTRCALDEG